MDSLPLWTALGAGLFIGIMLATILLSGLPKLTIRLLELTGLFKKDALQHAKRNYVDGSGHYVYRGVYLTAGPEGEKFENMRVFLRILIICLPVGFAAGILLWLIA